MFDNEQFYIVVEGPIGAGKTTLTKRLAEDIGSDLMLENVGDNPFFEHFYSNPERMALATQIHFLMDRVEQLEAYRGQRVIADYLLEKDRLFAEITLSEQEYQLYRRIFDRVVKTLPRPSLVVYLQAPVEVLIKRVHKRGRKFERGLDTTYLNQVNTTYAEFFHYYQEAPLLIVNAADIDFAHNESDYQQLFTEISAMEQGRKFFNPIAARKS